MSSCLLGGHHPHENLKQLKFISLVLLLGLFMPGVFSAESGSPWQTEVQTAIDQSAGKPLVLLFSSEGCTWCHRMLEESVNSAGIRQALTAVTPILVQAQQHPALVAQLGIMGYPTLVLINRKRELVRIIPGYLPEADLMTTIQVLALHGDNEGQRPFQMTQQLDLAAIRKSSTAVEQLIALLGTGSIEQRKQVRSALGGMSQARVLLFTALDHERLGVRIDAAAALSQQVGATSGYDPLAFGEERQASIKRWQAQSAITLPGGVTP